MVGSHWVLSRVMPPDWSARLGQTGGGFYHSPPGLSVSSPPGEPIYCTLMIGGEVSGVALGVRRQCRFSTVVRHYDFPSLPAVVDRDLQVESLDLLIEEVRGLGAAEISIYSFDSAWDPAIEVPRLNGILRQEYVVPLEGDPEAQASILRTTHRRHLRRGEREGWELRQLYGQEAVRVLEGIHRSTAERIEESGRDFVQFPAIAEAGRGAPGREVGWGIDTYAAYHGGELLAAAMVGRGGRRGYYIMGGSTPEGYRLGAASWMHWRIMCRLIEEGATAYNMGGSPGSPATAASPDDPHHGLYRFKTGLGAEPIPSRGGSWVLRPGHLRLHRVVELLRR